MILLAVIVFLDRARALGAELYSGGGSGPASWPAGWPAGPPASLPASPGCQIATFGREKFTFARFFDQKSCFGAQGLKTIKFRQISARAFHLSKYELHTMKLHPSYDMSKFRLGTSLLWVLDPGSRRRTLFWGGVILGRRGLAMGNLWRGISDPCLIDVSIFSL